MPIATAQVRARLTRDLLAGLTVWAVLVPEALAYATIAGVSPVVGLYAAPPALLLYAAFGSSRYLVVGPMAATAALSAAAVADLTTGGPEHAAAFTAMVALATGVLALLAGVVRLGFLADFISEPVLKGFIVGLALTIIIGQLPKLFGFERVEGNFFEQCWSFVAHLGETHWTTVAVGTASFALVVGLRRWAPAVPASLVAVAFGIGVVQLFEVDQHGVAIVGHIEAGAPVLGLPPGLGINDLFASIAAAAGIMLVAFVEGLGAAKAYGGDDQPVDANRELVALGAANLGSALCQGMVVNGSLSKTAVNVSAGARSQRSGVVAALATVVTLLFLTGLFEELPEATLGAIVVAALIPLVDVRALAELFQLSTGRSGVLHRVAARPDFVAAIAALVGVLAFDVLPGLVIGVTASFLLLLYRASRPHVATLGRAPGPTDHYTDLDRHPHSSAVPGVRILRVEGAIFFANAAGIGRCMREHAGQPDVRAVVLDAESVPFVDITAVRALAATRAAIERSGVRVVIAHDLGQVRDLVEAAGADDLTCDTYPSVQAAVDAVN